MGEGCRRGGKGVKQERRKEGNGVKVDEGKEVEKGRGKREGKGVGCGWRRGEG